MIEKVLFKQKRGWRSERKKKKHTEGLLTALSTAIKKDRTTSIRKHANELKVNEKTVGTAIKQDLSPDFNPFDFSIWGIFENKTSATSHPNTGLE